jgi:hypothetical protein
MTIGFLLLVVIYAEILHPIVFRSPSGDGVRYPFLPLMIYSAACTLVLMHVWILSVSHFPRYHTATHLSWQAISLFDRDEGRGSGVGAARVKLERKEEEAEKKTRRRMKKKLS